MTTSCSRRSLQPLRYSRDNVKTLHKLSKCCRWRCRSVMFRLWLNAWRNPELETVILLISFMEVVSCIPPSRSSQFVELYLLLPKLLHALLHCFGDCGHHPAGFVIFTQHALLSLFIILIFPILPIVRTCKITLTVSHSNQHLLKYPFGLSGHQSRDFSMCHIVLLLLNRCLCVFNFLSCPTGLSINLILNPFLFLFIVWEVRFWSLLRRKLLFGSLAAQCPKCSDSLCVQAALAFIRMMTSLGWQRCWFAVSAHRKWRKVVFRSIDHCSWCGICCWARCWMLQVMDNMEASCVFYVKVGTFTHLEQSKLSLLTVNILGIVTLTVQHDMIVSAIFM